MRGAIVTGATSGIGEAVSRMLLEDGWRVYGIGRDFSKAESLMSCDNFYAVNCDLGRYGELEGAVRNIKKVHGGDGSRIELLVNNAGTGYFGPHEQLNPSKIHEMVAVNLEAPMILSGLLLRELKEALGTIVNISSVTAKMSSTHGCAYGATKAGLTSFGESLFDEVRKYGVRVIDIHPDMTATNLYRNADFKEADEPDARLLPKEVAECVRWAVCTRNGAVVTDITIKPQKHKISRKKGGQ